MNSQPALERESPEPGEPTLVRSPWYRVAVGSAVVSGTFWLLVCALLFVNHFRGPVGNPLERQEYVDLKAAVAKAPGDDALKEKLRALDLRLREEYFTRRTFTDAGASLLLGSLVVFVLATKWAFAARARLPILAEEAQEAREERQAAASRWALGSVAAFSVVIFTAGLLVALLGPEDSRPALLAAAGAAGKQPPAAPAPPAGTALGPAPGTLPAPTGGKVFAPTAGEEPAPTARVEPAPTAGQKSAPSPGHPTREEIARNWPRFRGPGGRGISAFTNVPDSWDGATGEGILWKTEVPLPGENSPVVWEGRIFLTGATEAKREVYCFDASTGKLLWAKPVSGIPGSPSEPPEILEATGFAAPTAATDGQRVYAMFANGDLVSFDFSGNRVWAKSFWPLENTYGYASSLDVTKGLLFVLLDQATADDGKSALLALDVLTGRTVWQAKRPVSNSWATPIVAETSKGDQLITSADPLVIAYDPLTGAELWKVDCMAGDVAPSPVYSKDFVFVVHADTKLAAIRPDGKGDVTETHVAWFSEDNLPDICSPLATDEFVFLLTSSGKLTCFAAADGKMLWENKLGKPFNSSPSLVGNRVLLFDTKGQAILLEAAGEYKEIRRAQLGEETRTCPAFLDGRMYIRGVKNLYCLGRK